jgi:hypothetical protein
LRAPVQDIAELNEVGLAADPAEVVVDEGDLRVGEDVDELLEVAVEVGDGHDAVDARPGVGGLLGRGGEGEQGEEEQEKKERRSETVLPAS